MTQIDKVKFVGYRLQGLTNKQIAEKFKISLATVVRAAKKYGIPSAYHKTPPQKEKLVDALATHNTISGLADFYQVSCSTIKRWLGGYNLSTTTEALKNIKLTHIQKEVLVGTVLGDGHITKSGALHLAHGIAQKEYLEHKISWFSDLGPRISVVDGAVRGRTKVNTDILNFRQLFYPESIKIVPNIVDYITPLSLSYLFMDDGSKCRNNNYIYTCGFTETDNRLLCEMIEQKLDIKGAVREFYHRQAKRNYFKIFFSKHESKKLKEILSPHVIPTMLYKLVS